MEELQGQVVSTVISLVGALLAWAAVSARTFFKAKIENEYVSDVLLRFTSAVETSVLDAASTVVPEIKKAASDGKISGMEAEKLKRRVRDAAFDQLTRVDRQKLEELFDRDQLERKLDKLIEASVQRLKEGML